MWLGRVLCLSLHLVPVSERRKGEELCSQAGLSNCLTAHSNSRQQFLGQEANQDLVSCSSHSEVKCSRTELPKVEMGWDRRAETCRPRDLRWAAARGAWDLCFHQTWCCRKVEGAAGGFLTCRKPHVVLLVTAGGGQGLRVTAGTLSPRWGDAPGSGAGTVPTRWAGMGACGVRLPPLPLLFPWGFLGARQGGLACGMAGRGQQGLGEQRQRREAAGRAGGIAMATRAFGSLCRGARTATGPAMHPAAALEAALDPSFCGLGAPPAPTAVLPGEQPRGERPRHFVRLRQLLFAGVEALSCRAGPAGGKPVS